MIFSGTTNLNRLGYMWVKLSTKALFVFLSGLGWCFDFILFYILVDWFSWSSGLSNIASASLAAMLVFIVSQFIIFRAGAVTIKSILAYFLYIEINIAVCAAAIEILTTLLVDTQMIPYGLAAGISKVMITPLTLALNYFMASIIPRIVSNEKK